MEKEQMPESYSKEAFAKTEKHLEELGRYLEESPYGAALRVIVDDGKQLGRAMEWWQNKDTQEKLKELAQEEAEVLNAEFDRLNQNVVEALRALSDFKREKLGIE